MVTTESPRTRHWRLYITVASRPGPRAKRGARSSSHHTAHQITSARHHPDADLPKLLTRPLAQKTTTQKTSHASTHRTHGTVLRALHHSLSLSQLVDMRSPPRQSFRRPRRAAATSHSRLRRSRNVPERAGRRAHHGCRLCALAPALHSVRLPAPPQGGEARATWAHRCRREPRGARERPRPSSRPMRARRGDAGDAPLARGGKGGGAPPQTASCSPSGSAGMSAGSSPQKDICGSGMSCLT